MIGFQEKYINPFTDYGFKRLFGEEPNKDLLLDFLNELLKEEQGKITELTYLKNEHLGATALNRKAIFDLYCTNEKGEKFIVELQKTKQKFFKDRTIYYSTFPIQEQAKKGNDWDFELEKIYTIAILDFEFDDDKDYPNKFRYDVKLKELETDEVFSDKLNFIYLEMPKFNKEVDELETRFDKWLYVIKNLHKLERIPEKLKENIFLQLFESAEISKFTQQEYQDYENSLKYYRDLKNSLDTAKEEGIKEGTIQGKLEGMRVGKIQGKLEGVKEGKIQGKLEEKLEIAKTLLRSGVGIDIIIQSTGLTEKTISDLKNMKEF